MKKLLLIPFLFFAISTTIQAQEYVFLGQDYEPFNWHENGKIKGGMADVTHAVCQKMKISCVVKIFPMKRVMSQLEDGSIDGVLSLIYNKDREAYVTLSVPIIKSNMSLHAVKNTISPFSDKKMLTGVNIGATATSSAAKLAESIKIDIKDVTIEYETGLPFVLKKLSAGRYGKRGLGIANEDVARTYMQKAEINNVTPVHVVESGRFAIAFSKKKVDPKFIKQFNDTLIEMKKNGELEKILKPYGLKPDLDLK